MYTSSHAKEKYETNCKKEEEILILIVYIKGDNCRGGGLGKSG